MCQKLITLCNPLEVRNLTQAPEMANALEAGASYDLVVNQGDEEIGRAPFLVSASATTQDWTATPAKILQTALARVSGTPPTYGDALALLSQLPEEQQGDALVQRLRLLAFGASVLKAEFDEDLNALRAP